MPRTVWRMYFYGVCSGKRCARVGTITLVHNLGVIRIGGLLLLGLTGGLTWASEWP